MLLFDIFSRMAECYFSFRGVVLLPRHPIFAMTSQSNGFCSKDLSDLNNPVLTLLTLSKVTWERQEVSGIYLNKFCL